MSCVAGLLGGIIGAIFTNGFECVTVAKQTNPSISIAKLVSEHSRQLLTRGLYANILYSSSQAVLQFNLLLGFGKLYNVELAD